MISTRANTALNQARAAFVLAAIRREGTPLDASWYDYFRRQGLSRADLDRALNQLASSGKIVIEASDLGVWARRAGSEK